MNNISYDVSARKDFKVKIGLGKDAKVPAGIHLRLGVNKGGLKWFEGQTG